MTPDSRWSWSARVVGIAWSLGRSTSSVVPITYSRRCVPSDMPARQGAEHHHSGAHLPTSPSKADPADIGDPAQGEKVPRCLTCGSPTAPITGTFIPDRTEPFAGRPFRYRLCLRCLSHANGPVPADPLDVTEAA